MLKTDPAIGGSTHGLSPCFGGPVMRLQPPHRIKTGIAAETGHGGWQKFSRGLSLSVWRMSGFARASCLVLKGFSKTGREVGSVGTLIGKVLRVDAAGVWTERDEAIPGPGEISAQPGAMAAGSGGVVCGELHCWIGRRTNPPPDSAPFAITLEDESIWLACHADGGATLLMRRPASCVRAPDPVAVLNRLMLAIGAQRATQLGRLSFPPRPQIVQPLPEKPQNWCDGSLPADATTRHT